MPGPKTLTLPGTTWQTGATWQTNIGSDAYQTVIDYVNDSGVPLYTGDVVILGTAATTPDPTALNVFTTTTASSPYVIGVVGGETNMAYAGGPVPGQLAPTRYDACTTQSTTVVLDASAAASYVNLGVVGAGIPSGAYIVSTVPGTSFTMNVSATASASVTLAIGPRTSSIGPGWQGYPVGEVMPVVVQGWGYVNIGSNTLAAGSQVTTSTTARVANTVGTAGSLAALQALLGTFIAVTLEAYNASGVITSGDGSASVLVRSIIGRF